MTVIKILLFSNTLSNNITGKHGKYILLTRCVTLNQSAFSRLCLLECLCLKFKLRWNHGLKLWTDYHGRRRKHNLQAIDAIADECRPW